MRLHSTVHVCLLLITADVIQSLGHVLPTFTAVLGQLSLLSSLRW